MADPVDVLITGGTLVFAGGLRPATVAIHDGRIAKLLEPTARPASRRTVDAGGLHLLPGIIDTHVNTRRQGPTSRENIESATAAAAAGGITTFIEVPVGVPPVHDARSLGERAIDCREGALVDFALYGGAGHDVDAIAEQAAAGAVGFTTSLHTKAPQREDAFAGIRSADRTALQSVMAAVARTGLPHGFCGADTSIAEVLAMGATTGDRVHILSLSSPETARLVADARRAGQPVTAETCAHHLVHPADPLPNQEPVTSDSPSLRTRDEVGLWPYLLDGTIDVIGSHHDPGVTGNNVAGGLELLLPLMLTAVRDGRLTLSDVARLLSERAATLFDLPGKGRVVEGADADLVLVDLESDRVVTTLVRGTEVFREGEVLATAGFGKFVRPPTLWASGIATE